MDNNKISYEHLFTDELKKEFNNKQSKVKRIYAVMFFNTEFELGISNKPYTWVNSSNHITTDGQEALAIFVTSHNPVKELVDAESFEELNKKMIEMANKFKSEDFVNSYMENVFF